MHFLDTSHQDPAANIALDEAILLAAESGQMGESLRLWESPTYFACLGWSNQLKTETHQENCQKDHVKIIRRISGGGTVLQGPGCLNYCLILSHQKRPQTKTIQDTNLLIMQKHCEMFQKIGLPVEHKGTTDLTLKGLKFSGNAQRRKQKYSLFHGTFLYQMNLNLVTKYLRHPTKEPHYRQKRSHQEFITNLPITPEDLSSLLKKTWQTEEPKHFPFLKKQVEQLVLEKYNQPTWNQNAVTPLKK